MGLAAYGDEPEGGVEHLVARLRNWTSVIENVPPVPRKPNARLMEVFAQPGSTVPAALRHVDPVRSRRIAIHVLDDVE